MNHRRLLFHSTLLTPLSCKLVHANAAHGTIAPGTPWEELAREVAQDAYDNQSQCDAWIEAAVESDADSSGGLDKDEFYSFIDTISDGSYSADSSDGDRETVDGLFYQLLGSNGSDGIDGIFSGMARSGKSGKSKTLKLFPAETKAQKFEESSNSSKSGKLSKGGSGKSSKSDSSSKSSKTSFYTLADGDVANSNGGTENSNGGTENSNGGKENSNGNWHNGDQNGSGDEISISGFQKDYDERTDAEEEHATGFCDAIVLWVVDEVSGHESIIDNGDDDISNSNIESSFTSSTVSGTTASTADGAGPMDDDLSGILTASGDEEEDATMPSSSSETSTGATTAPDGDSYSVSSTAESDREGSSTLPSSDSESDSNLSPDDSSSSQSSGQTRSPYNFSFIGSSNDEFTATEVMNEEGNTIFEDVSLAFWKVSLSVLEMMGIEPDEGALSESRSAKIERNRLRQHRRLSGNAYIEEDASFVFESIGTNVIDVFCPSATAYAATDEACLEFIFALTSRVDGPLDDDAKMQEFLLKLLVAINNGVLYKMLIEINPMTEMIGVGSPGGGIPFEGDDSLSSSEEFSVRGGGEDETIDAGGGLSVAAIAGIAAVAVIFCCTCGVVLFRKRRNSAIEEEIKDREDTAVGGPVEATPVESKDDIKRGLLARTKEQ